MTMNPMVVPGLQSIEDIAAQIWDIDKNLLTTNTRKREVVECRHVLMNYRNLVMKQSQAKSASYYNKEHATTINSNKKVDEFLFSDSEFKRKYNDFHLKDEIQSKLVNLMFGIAAPVTQDATKIEFVIVDKAGYQEASVISVDRSIFKAFVNGIMAQWMIKVGLTDIAKLYLVERDNAIVQIINESIELRKPSLT